MLLSALPYHTGEGPCLSLSLKSPEFLRGIKSDRLKAANIHDIIAGLKIKAVGLKRSFAVPLNR